ncbi:N-acetylmuramoyl-L-alanine amidase [Enterococcus mediterraneensis]|uniref:N-acetylmuramoyl-L-alanine amidase n=1 Tax=Enterococcus mediterraneensis TaxID=2364791 RepID=UPI001F152A9A|nr:N-acetylmuramoyl-L-alanine amidase [Enterococcus mediterraneensis]
MAEHLIVYGHGQGDPGAGGNGYQEATFTRNILGPHLEKYAKQLKKNKVKFYDKSLDMYQQTQTGKGAYSVSTKTASVTELHLDAASSSATGGHVIISSSFSPDKYDVAIAAVIGKYVGWWGSVKNTKGINKRSDLLNLNVFAKRGISYRLVELGFITNKNDVDKLVKNIDAVAKDLIEAITGEKISGTASKPAAAKPVAKPKPTPAKPAVIQLKVDGQFGNATARRLQEYFNTAGKDGIISHQYKQKYNQNIYAAQFDKTLIGSNVVVALQKWLKVEADGLCGKATIIALQKRMGTTADGFISPVSDCVKELQRRLNKNKL